jgi:hypothetical protein
MTQVTDQAIAVRDEQAITRADPEQAAGALQHILATGDLAKLSNTQRVHHYLNLCASLGLNPASRPFDWIEFYDPETKSKKLTLYFNQSGAAQLRRNHQISVHVIRRDVIGGDGDEPMCVVEMGGKTPNGRDGVAIKYVSLMGYNQQRGKYRLGGQQLANAYMKAETGALRRLALSMVGLSSGPDVDELRDARVVVVDGTGQIVENPTEQARALAADPRLARTIGEPVYEDMKGDVTESAGYVNQAPSIEELEPPKRPYQPPVRFHCDAPKWRATWFFIVDKTFLADDDERHNFIRWYTAGWPENRRTDSLTTFLAHATDRQAEQLINAARETIADRAQAIANDPDGELDGIDGLSAEDADREAVRQAGYEARPEALEGVRAAAILTGAPTTRTADEQLVRPDEESTYSRAQWVNMYIGWAGRMRALDVTFRAADIDKLGDAQLRTKTLELVGQVEATEALLAQADDEPPAF